jgi:3-oxoacyl-ACP reductase-like protein
LISVDGAATARKEWPMGISIELGGKIALITGASQGIGAQMARTFHSAGATVVLNHPDLGSTRADAEELARELNALRMNSTHVVAADVSNAEAVQAMMKTVHVPRRMEVCPRCGSLRRLPLLQVWAGDHA